MSMCVGCIWAIVLRFSACSYADGLAASRRMSAAYAAAYQEALEKM